MSYLMLRFMINFYSQNVYFIIVNCTTFEKKNTENTKLNNFLHKVKSLQVSVFLFFLAASVQCHGGGATHAEAAAGHQSRGTESDYSHQSLPWTSAPRGGGGGRGGGTGE